jgi:hypothetical protein
MKSKFALMGFALLALAACDKKEEITDSAKPGVAKTKVVRPDSKPAGLKAAAFKPAPPAEPAIEQSSAVGLEDASPPPVAAPQPASPPAALSATGKTTEQLTAERLERMAKARDERRTEMTAQLTTRLKEQDVNGDGLLAKDEMSGRMQRRFGEADKNADGFLDATEQQAMIQASAQRAGEGGGQRRNGQGGGPNRQGRGNRNP